MSALLWVVQILIALAFLGSGFVKLTKSREELQPTMEWVEDFSPGTVRFVGAMEVLAGVGLLVPSLTGIAPVLSAVAAVGLVLLMVGATVTHVRRHEVVPNAVVPLALLAMAAFVAWGRFGPYAL